MFVHSSVSQRHLRVPESCLQFLQDPLGNAALKDSASILTEHVCEGDFSAHRALLIASITGTCSAWALGIGTTLRGFWKPLKEMTEQNLLHFQPVLVFSACHICFGS